MCMREQPCRSRRTHDALPHLQHPMHAAAIGGRSLLVCTMVFGRMWLGGALRGVCSVPGFSLPGDVERPARARRGHAERRATIGVLTS